MKRLDQLLSNTGYCSRRDAFALARQGRITVGGQVVSDSSKRVDPREVRIDSEPLDHPEGILVMVNKPAGYVSSHDPSEGTRVYDLLPEQWLLRKPLPVSIGRLDKDTSGLLLITDNGTLVHKLTSPKQHVQKTYEVTVEKELDKSLIELFGSGTLIIPDETTPLLPATMEFTGPSTCTLILTEGRFRQIRRMFASQGYTVLNLHRTKFGPYELGDLPEGEFLDVE